jgi:hypothetical protein
MGKQGMASFTTITQFIDRLLLTTFAFFIAVLVAVYIAFAKEFYIEASFFALCTVVAGVLLIGQMQELATEY